MGEKGERKKGGSLLEGKMRKEVKGGRESKDGRIRKERKAAGNG